MGTVDLVASVLVVGGTGALGRRLVPVLLERGHQVRVLSRRAAVPVHDGAEACQGDIRTGAGIAVALRDVDTVVQAVASRRHPKATELEGIRTLLSGIGDRHLVYVSIVGVDRHRFPYFRVKLHAEQILEEAAPRWSIQRATQFHDLVDLFLGKGLFFRTPRLRFQPVATEDVSIRLAELVEAGPSGHAPDFGGPEVLSIDELNATRAAITGRSARLLPLPAAGFLADYDEGLHLAPDHRSGTVTWEQWLRRRALS